jgi:hypothetical protein
MTGLNMALRKVEFAFANDETDMLVAGLQLSTDYLNRYNEALMLIEMAAFDISLVEDLQAWKPLSYIEHFNTSRLRCAPGAVLAFEALPPNAKGAFNSLCMAMDQLVKTVVHALSELRHPEDAVFIVDIAVGSFKSMLSRTTAFINTNGDMAAAAFDERSAQETVDTIVAM